jgi:hypothetical protein
MLGEFNGGDVGICAYALFPNIVPTEFVTSSDPYWTDLDAVGEWARGRAAVVWPDQVALVAVAIAIAAMERNHKIEQRRLGPYSTRETWINMPMLSARSSPLVAAQRPSWVR